MRDTAAGQRGPTATHLSVSEVITMPHPDPVIEPGGAQPHRHDIDAPLAVPVAEHVAEHVAGEAAGLSALVATTGAATAQSHESTARLPQVPSARTARPWLNPDQVHVAVCSRPDRLEGGGVRA